MKTIFIVFTFLFMSISLFACDICNVYMGLTPNSNVNYFQVSYRSRMHKGFVENNSFKPVGLFNLRHGGASENELKNKSTYKQLYNVYDIRGKFYMNNKQRISLFFSLPLANNYQSIDNVSDIDIVGFSDPLLIVNYDLIKSSVYDTTTIKNEFSIGVGLKAPLGNHKVFDGEELIDNDLQLGSGSWDIVMVAQYVLKFKNLGFQFSPSYKINTSNKKQFKFGNTLNIGSNLFYMFKLNANLTLIPTLGTFYESANDDKENGIKIDNTKNNVLFSSIGAKLMLNKFSIGSSWEQVIHQKNGDYQIPVNNRLNVNFQYNF